MAHLFATVRRKPSHGPSSTRGGHRRTPHEDDRHVPWVMTPYSAPRRRPPPPLFEERLLCLGPVRIAGSSAPSTSPYTQGLILHGSHHVYACSCVGSCACSCSCICRYRCLGVGLACTYAYMFLKSAVGWSKQLNALLVIRMSLLNTARSIASTSMLAMKQNYELRRGFPEERGSRGSSPLSPPHGPPNASCHFWSCEQGSNPLGALTNNKNVVPQLNQANILEPRWRQGEFPICPFLT